MRTGMVFVPLAGLLPDIRTFILFRTGTAVMSRPTPAFSGTAGDLHKTRRV